MLPMSPGDIVADLIVVRFGCSRASWKLSILYPSNRQVDIRDTVQMIRAGKEAGAGISSIGGGQTTQASAASGTILMRSRCS